MWTRPKETLSLPLQAAPQAKPGEVILAVWQWTILSDLEELILIQTCVQATPAKAESCKQKFNPKNAKWTVHPLTAPTNSVQKDFEMIWQQKPALKDSIS